VFASSHISREELIAYNEFCRAQEPPVGFVLAESRGVFGCIFTDFSDRHATEVDASALSIKEFRLVTQMTRFGDRNSATLHTKEQILDACCVLEDHVRFRDDEGRLVRDRRGETLTCRVTEVINGGAVRVALLPSQHAGEQREPLRDELEVALRRAKWMRKALNVCVSKCHSLRRSIIDPGDVMFPLRSPSLTGSSM
jgi:hypothetical protein